MGTWTCISNSWSVAIILLFGAFQMFEMPQVCADVVDSDLFDVCCCIWEYAINNGPGFNGK